MTLRPGSVSAGFAALRHGKLILLLAATAAVLGVCAALPLMPALRATMLETLAGDHFVRNHPTFAPTDLLDFLQKQGPAVDATRRAVGGMGVLGVILQIFYAGGIVAVLGRGPFAFGQFFEPARRNFWHNVKCFLLFAVAAAVVLGAWLGGVGYGLHKLFEDARPDSAARSLAQWILVLVALLLWAALSLLYDFARAARRYAPHVGAWRGYRFARRVLAGSWTRALGLWILWLLLGGAAVLGLFAVTWGMRAASRPAIVVLMLLQFGVLWLRSAARVAAWGSYLAFLDPRSHRALSEVARVRVVMAPAPAAPAPLPLS